MSSSEKSSDTSDDDSFNSVPSPEPSFEGDDEAYLQFLRAENPVDDSDSELESSETLCNELTVAVVKNNIDEIKNLITLNAPKLFSVKDNFGYTLLQECMRRKNKELFDYMLSLEDLDLECVNCFGQTALMVALDSSGIDYINVSTSDAVQLSDHYAYELIKKGAFTHSVYTDGDSLLHKAIADSSVRVTTLLLEKGIDVNAQDRRGYTALHRLLSQRSREEDHELFAALIYYGADPWIENNHEYTAFEFAVKYNNIFPIQETLFNYTFDKYTRCKIHLDVLLLLAKINSPFFHQVVNHIHHIIVENWKLDDLFYSLSQIEEVYANILLDKFNLAISQVIATTYVGYGYGLAYEKIFEAPVTPRSLRLFNMLMESKVKSYMLDFMGTLKDFCNYTIMYEKVDEPTATALVLYMLSYGLELRENDLHTVYRTFGHCELFKNLLHMEFVTDFRNRYYKNDIITRFIYDVTIDLEYFLKDPRRYPARNINRLLDYFVHPKLTLFLHECIKYSHLSETDTRAVVRKMTNQPRVPLLVELSRNVFRKYFIDKFEIKTGRQFFTLINCLLISPVHKKIITYETEIY